jgi:hypothetical protein
MSVTIKLYKNTSEQNRLDKTKYIIGPLKILTGEFRSDVNILTPVVDIELPTDFLNINLNAFNYVRIEEFNRYYFVNSMDICNGNGTDENKTVLLRLYLQVDVLMSWKTDILELRCFVIRQENSKANLIIDRKRPFLNECELFYTYDTSNTTELFPYTNANKLPRDEYGRTFCYTINIANGSYGFQHGTNVTPFNYCYISDGEGVKQLAKYLYKTFVGFFEKPSEGFISLHYYPFRIDNIIKKNSTYTETSTINVGLKEFNNELTPKTYLSPNSNFSMGVYTVSGGKISIPKISNFTQLSPFTTYDLFIPYVGWIKLNNNIISNCSGKNLLLFYTVDFINHEVTYVLVNEDFYKISEFKTAYLMGKCNMGCEIPLSTSNYNEIIKKLILGSLKGIVNVGTSIANYNSINNAFDKMSDKRTNAYKTQKNIMQTEQTGKLLNSVVDYGVNAALQSQENIDQIGEVNGTYTYIRYSNSMILRTSQVVPANINLSDYGRYIGFPYIGSAIIRNLIGYTEVGSVHVENINCLENERDEIESILKSGFIA